jgi:hypothetical protein
MKTTYWTICFTSLFHSEADDCSVCQNVGIVSKHMAKLPKSQMFNMLDALA